MCMLARMVDRYFSVDNHVIFMQIFGALNRVCWQFLFMILNVYIMPSVLLSFVNIMQGSK